MDIETLYYYISNGIKIYYYPWLFISETFIFTKSNLSRILQYKRNNSPTVQKTLMIKNDLEKSEIEIIIPDSDSEFEVY